MSETPNPIEEFMKTLSTLPANAPTSCEDWTVHEVVAHLAAGIEECAELMEDVLNGVPVRPTRYFDEREAPYLAMPDDECREKLVGIVDRSFAALEGLAAVGQDATVEFFDRPWTAAQLGTHAGNEFAVHRWDMIGDDEIGDVLMSPPQVTQSAFQTLNTLPMLDEAPAARTARAGLTNTRVVLRCAEQPDIALVAGESGQAYLQMSACGPLDGDVVVTTDAVNRLLTLWGRRSSLRPISVSGDPALWPRVAAALWADAPAWSGAAVLS
jgi:Mycothiol maleylpyruvate isomerase N-terminal domain/MDMPI C-terminal domain